MLRVTNRQLGLMLVGTCALYLFLFLVAHDVIRFTDGNFLTPGQLERFLSEGKRPFRSIAIDLMGAGEFDFSNTRGENFRDSDFDWDSLPKNGGQHNDVRLVMSENVKLAKGIEDEGKAVVKFLDDAGWRLVSFACGVELSRPVTLGERFSGKREITAEYWLLFDREVRLVGWMRSRIG